MQFPDVSPGNYRLIIRATATTGETAVVRRPVYVCTLSRGLGKFVIMTGERELE
jgi:hypothetical protein